MDERYLIDSNVVIDFCNGKLPNKGRDLLLGIKPEISIITNIELFATNNISESESSLLRRFVDFSIVHSVDKYLVDSTIEIRQKYKIKLPDALIAGTALYFNLKLITRNSKDFMNIEGLELINPYGL